MSDDRIILYPLIASLIAIIIAYFRIWSITKEQGREARRELREKNEAIRRDFKDYIALRLENVNNKIEHINQEIKQIRDWIQRIEDSRRR